MYLYQDNNMRGFAEWHAMTSSRNSVIKLLFTERRLALLGRWYF